MQVLKHRTIRLARLMAVPALALTLAALSPASTSAHAGNQADQPDVAPLSPLTPVHAVAPLAAPAPPSPPAPPSSRRSHRDRDDDERDAVKRAWLGVVLGGDSGNRINSVSEDSPAEEAGLRRGDRIVGIEGDEIESAGDIFRTMRSMSPGDRVTVTVQRGGDEKTVTVTLRERPAMNRREFKFVTPEPFDDDDDDDSAEGDHDFHGELGDEGMRHHEIIMRGPSRNFLGVEIHPMSEELRSAMKAPSDRGVLVNRVVDGSPADEAGIRAGDVIVGVADEEIEDAGDIGRALRDREPGDEVSVKVIRGGSERSLDVKVGRRTERSGLPGRRGFMLAPKMDLKGLDDIQVDGQQIREAVQEAVEEAVREAQKAMEAAHEAMRVRGMDMRKMHEEIQKQQEQIRDQVRRELEREQSTIRARSVFDI